MDYWAVPTVPRRPASEPGSFAICAHRREGQMHLSIRALAIVAIMLGGCSHIGGGQPGHPTLPDKKFLTYTKTNAEIVAGSYLVMFDTAAVSEASVPVLANSLVAGTNGKV